MFSLYGGNMELVGREVRRMFANVGFGDHCAPDLLQRNSTTVNGWLSKG